MALPGDLALISQSGAVAAAMIDWGRQKGVGFSGIVSVGDQLDVDIADLLDHFALDVSTRRAILMYVELIGDARKFMSAARAAARIKPVVVVKAGRMPQGAKAAATHTGALAGSDAVYSAAFRRAGLVRVFDLRQLFDCAETLGRKIEAVGSAARDPQPMAAALGSWRSTGWSSKADGRPRLARRHGRSLPRTFHRRGRTRTPSTSSAMRTQHAILWRWKRCSPTRRMTPFWS